MDIQPGGRAPGSADNGDRPSSYNNIAKGLLKQGQNLVDCARPEKVRCLLDLSKVTMCKSIL